MKVASIEAAQAGAAKGFRDYGLLSRPDWRPLLTPPVRALDPVFVERLDAAEDSYYLVPFGLDDSSVGAAALVDGASGEYLEANAFVPRGSTRTWGAMIADWRSEDKTRQRILEGKYRRKQGEPLEVDPGSVRVHPAFVWKPCYESRSPYYPLRRVTIGDEVRYVRIDGIMFDELTDLNFRRPPWMEYESD